MPLGGAHTLGLRPGVHPAGHTAGQERWLVIRPGVGIRGIRRHMRGDRGPDTIWGVGVSNRFANLESSIGGNGPLF